jgi:hypothetical protein
VSDEQTHLLFEPGTGLRAEIAISLCEGFTCVSSLFLMPMDADGQQTIFIFDNEHQEVAELFCDRVGGLHFGVGNLLVSISSDDTKPFLNKWVMVLLSCKIEEGIATVELSINLLESSSRKDRYEGLNDIKGFAMGGGEGYFKLGENHLLKGVADREGRAQSFEYLKAKWSQ